jgi:hypothetical protein
MASEFMALLEKSTPLITAVFGGIGVKVLDKILSKRSDVFNESVKIREELRAQIDSLRKELEEWKSEADEWRRKYWEQVEVNISQKSLLETLRAEFDAFKEKEA